MTASNTTGIKRHLQKCHQTEFEETYPLAINSEKPLDQKLFDEKIVDWAAKKYLPLSFFDDDETRELFHYLNSTVEVPMRNKMKLMVLNRFKIMQDAVKRILLNMESKLSFTLDGWSSIIRKSYIGITCHFIDHDWELHSLLLDFVPCHGFHAGKDTAKLFYESLQDFQITEKVLGITVDNTSANFRFMKELSHLMTFDHKNQHFQCYPHILNIAVQGMLKSLGLEITSDEDNIGDEEHESEDDGDVHEQTNDDTVNVILSEVETTYQASPLSKLRNLFKILKNSEQWKNKLESSCQVCGIKMLSPNIDVKTRWDSTCDMINLGLRMQKALILLCEKNIVLNKLMISDNEWLLLQEIYKYLRHFKALSKTLGGEKYPTLNLVVVGFNMLLEKIEDSISGLQKKLRNPIEENIISALQVGLEKLLKHYDKSNWIYCVVLILDPRHKLETFDATKWGREMKTSSLEIFKNIYKTQYYKAPEQTINPIEVESDNYLESANEDDGVLDIFSLYKEPKGPSATTTNNGWQREILLYSAEERAYATVDVLKWWKMNEKKYPNMARMARDFLAVSASSVPSERVFSRSSLTVRKHRNRLSDRAIRCLMGVNSWVTCSLSQKIKSTMAS